LNTTSSSSSSRYFNTGACFPLDVVSGGCKMCVQNYSNAVVRGINHTASINHTAVNGTTSAARQFRPSQSQGRGATRSRLLCPTLCQGRWLPLALARSLRRQALQGRKFERRTGARTRLLRPGAARCRARASPSSGRRSSLRPLPPIPPQPPMRVPLRQASKSRRHGSRAPRRQRKTPPVYRGCGKKFRRPAGRTMFRWLGWTER
jgi:hypothetical protein